MFLQYCKELKQILQNTSFFICLSVCKNFPSLAGKPKCFQIITLASFYIMGGALMQWPYSKVKTVCIVEIIEQLMS